MPRTKNQRGQGKSLRQLTSTLFSAPWDLSKDELRILANLSPEEYAANTDGATVGIAKKYIEEAKRTLLQPEVAVDNTPMSKAEEKVIEQMEQRVMKGLKQDGGFRYQQRGSALTKEQLKQMALDYGIDCKGTKAQLCDRVLNALFPAK